MPDHVDPHQDFNDLTRKCITYLWRQLCSFITRNFIVQIGRPDRNSLSLGAGGENYSTVMACTDPIDIISSDSEDDTELVTGWEVSLPSTSAASAPARKLPSWASTLNTKPNGYSGSFQHRELPERASSATRSLTNHNHASEVDFQKYPSLFGMDATTDQLVDLDDDQDLFAFNQNVNHPVNSLLADHSRSINSRYSDMAGDDHSKVSSHQSLRRLPPSLQRSAPTVKASTVNGGNSKISDTRSNGYQSLGLNDTNHKMRGADNIDGKNNNAITMYGHVGSRNLPPSFQSSALTAKGKTSMENGTNTQISGMHIKPCQSLGPNAIDHKIHRAYDFGGKSKNEAIMHESNGSRLLPASLTHAKLLPNIQSAGPSDPSHRSGVEGPTENDERLIYQAALQNLSQPKTEATLPEGLLAVPLLKHQKIALAWMQQKETTSVPCSGGILADDQGLGKTISMIALILLQRPPPSKSTALDIDTVKTEALTLDDDDEAVSGMGGIKQSGESDAVKTFSKIQSAVPTFHKRRPPAGTLVVCPASVLRQWARELDDKVTSSAKLSVLIYHGGSRTKDPDELAKHDVVLTTYAIVANEVPKQPLAGDDDEDKNDGEKYGLSSEFSNNKKRKNTSNVNKKGKKGRKGLDSSFDCGSGTLAKVGWFRVILDEAQTIKNHRTQVARACCGLRAKRRWCLSGTPIQNTIDDLFSYFRFLKYDPFAAYRSFCSSIKYPISKNSAHGYKKLQAVLKTIMLRRTKGTLLDGEPIINIPPKSISLVKVDFSVEERKFYAKLEADSRSQFKAYAAAGTVNQNYASILLMLLRLRQACDHPLLVKGRDSDFVGKASVEMARRLPRDMLMNLLHLLEDPICSLCSDPPEQAVVTMCGHVFCYQCVSEYLTGDDNLCPAHECKEQVGTDVVFAKATLRNCISDDFSDTALSLLEGTDKSLALQNMYTSSKIRAALEIIEKQSNSIQEEKPFKAIVFSQWTGMLDLVETSLNHACIQYRRFDGTMSLASRDKAVKDFNNDPEVTVMLMSLKAGNLGLNLVAACHVILLDLWWNPTTEDQAVDRAHRIGQTRPVTVSRLTITDTVEDRILSLQEDKRKMVASAFGEDQNGGSATRLTVDDLRYLFMV